MQQLKTVILCGGLGTRIREETEFKPKPMVKIGNRPILWHTMKIYAHYGYTDFVLALGYKGEMIKDYFCHYELMNNDVTVRLGDPEYLCVHDTHNECGWNITLSNTGEKTLKGGRIKRIEKYIDGDTFMLTYGDGVANIDIKKLIDFHLSHGKIATLTGINPTSRFGELQINKDKVVSFIEKPEVSHKGRINGGFFVLNRKVFDYLTEDENCDFEYGPLETIASEGELMVYKHDGFWACMDTLRDMEYLNNLWQKEQPPWKIWTK